MLDWLILLLATFVKNEGFFFGCNGIFENEIYKERTFAAPFRGPFNLTRQVVLRQPLPTGNLETWGVGRAALSYVS